MKRNIVGVSLILLIGLALTFTQVFANTSGAPALKKTPSAGQPEVKQGQKEEKKESNQAERSLTKEARQAEKELRQEAKDAQKKLKKEKMPDVPKGQMVNFRGRISAIGGDSIDLDLKGGGSQTVDTNADTVVHIPTLEKGANQAGLGVGMEVTVHAQKQPEGNPLALQINVIPGQPAHLHKIGTVTEYLPGERISIEVGDGRVITYAISETGTRILPDPDAEIGEGTRVTIVSRGNGIGEDPLFAQAIVVHQLK